MALFVKLPFCLVTLFVVVTFGDQEVDNWQAPYHYWSPDGNNQLANHDYRRQYATTPNLMNHLGSPGVAACLFLSSAGVSFSSAFFSFHYFSHTDQVSKGSLVFRCLFWIHCGWHADRQVL